MNGRPTPGTAPTPAVGALPASPNLDVAVHVARDMLAAYGATDYADHCAVAQAFGATREALRILLRALDGERGEVR